MSDEEEELVSSYGTPLEPYDEDAFPKRKPITIEDQIATDAHGRRRFHGAFTGGFSAGFFNTVGSLEGWTPSEFKSSRQDKAKQHVQKPQDFMDDEDTGEYGIAAQKIRATNEFSTLKKRPRQVYSDGPIPGVPVLETLLTSGNETVGYLLLRNMGIRDKVKKQQEEVSGKVYGCEMPTRYQISNIEDKEYIIPEIYKQFLDKPKINSAGLGYEGLEKPHVNLFQQSKLTVRDKNNKMLSVGGQAFGVGAFEEDDDDIYAKDDLGNYDFELTKEKESNKKDDDTSNLLFGLFKKSKIPSVPKKIYTPPNIPQSFTGIHKVRKSRFQPLEDETENIPRSRINPAIRAKYLGEEPAESYTSSSPVLKSETKPTHNKVERSNLSNKSFDPASLLSDKFVSASQQEDISNILEPVKKLHTDHGTQEMRDAAGMKMYGPLTRITNDWHPCALLCKRFNVPEPFLDRPNEKNKKRTKNLIFEYQKHTEEEPTLTPGISTEMEIPSENIKVEENSNQEFTDNKTDDTAIPSTSQIIHQNEETVKDVNIIKEEVELPPLDITDKIGVANKVDLYKAVFLDSSSESEDENEDIKDEQKSDNTIEHFKSTVLSDDLIPKIKPLKEGILSNIDFSSFNKNKQLPSTEGVRISSLNNVKEEDNISQSTTELSYGPQLPIKNEVSNCTSSQITILTSSDSDDCWIEKDKDSKKKKHKYKKKSKKEKHKKHKHKKNKH